MGKNELLKRSVEVGTSLIDMTRERAESVVKELVDAGVVRKGQAEKAIDTLVDRSRKRTEALGAVIRREVGEQLAAFGVATKDDVARLEAKLQGEHTAGGGPESDPARPAEPARTKAAPINKSASRAPKGKPNGGASKSSPPPTMPPEAR